MSDPTGHQVEQHGAAIEDYLAELRTFPPPEEFARSAVVRDRAMFEQAAGDREAFWADQAKALTWFEPWEQVLDWQPPFAKWFVGGRLNVAFNCLDRHVEAGLGDRVAFHFEGEPGDRRTITYAELLDEVGRCANALRALGVERGDRVAIYMPMIPELPVAMLACARIGAAHSVVFGGFSADALRDRIEDASARLLITADGGWRRGHAVELKRNADHALSGGARVHRERSRRAPPRRRGDRRRDATRGVTSGGTSSCSGQDPHSPPEAMDAEDLLFLLYTSGTTARPKGIMHTTGGYLTQVAFTPPDRLRPEARDRRLLVRRRHRLGHRAQLHRLRPARERRHERPLRGDARLPRPGPLVVDRRALRGHDPLHGADRHPDLHEVGHRVPRCARPLELRLLGSVGEPINPEAWIWYWQHIGGGRCPVVDTWWQTETGAIMISPLPGITTLKPGSATFPLPGIGAEVVDDAGESGRERRRRLPDSHPPVAGDAARHLRRPGALP